MAGPCFCEQFMRQHYEYKHVAVRWANQAFNETLVDPDHSLDADNDKDNE